MSDMFTQLLGVAAAAACGGFAAWVAIRVDVALARRLAEDAKTACDHAHSRISEHIERHHTHHTRQL